MGSLGPTQILSPPLIPTEHIGPKGWIRYIYVFGLPDNYDAAEVERILRGAFKAAKGRTPLLGCEAVPDLQTGGFKLREYGDEIPDFKAKDLRAPGLFPSFAELKAKKFPITAFENDVVCYREEWPQPGDRIPVTLMQANFITGGLVLNWCIFHAFADGNTCYKFSEVLAEEVRKAQGIKITKPAEIPSEDRDKVLRSSGRNPGRLEEHPEYTLLPFTPTSAPPGMLLRNNQGRIWYFSPESLAALKQEASDPEHDSWVSTNDAIAALVWRTVMTAQHTIAEEEDRRSLISVAVDGRRRTRASVHKDTLGNFLGFASAEMDLARLVDAPLAEIAQGVRRAIAGADQDYLDDLTTVIEAVDPNRLVPTVFLDMPGLNTLYTTWRDFPLYDLEWGTAFGGKMHSVRLPVCGMCHAAQIVLPGLPDGGVEVFVGVEDRHVERLMRDERWLKYAEFRN